MIPSLTPHLLAASLLVSALGFIRVVYFVSTGYAFSIVTMAFITAIALRTGLTAPVAIQLALLAVWGLRLGVFIASRERKSAYRDQLEGNQSYDRGMAFAKRLPIWIGVALLYVVMFAPALFAAADARSLTGFPLAVQVAGVAIMALGFVLETAADAQKSAFKAACAHCFTAIGLYRWVRCPNYLGEILFWTGNLLAGAPFLTGPLRILAALIGWACLVLIMMGSTKRLERQQEKRYGADPAFQHYITTVPVLFPWVPIYTLKNVRVYLE